MYKLLIVDDEYEIRNGLHNYFPWNELGFEVVGCAEDGRQALSIIHNAHVDVVLCDIKMPRMSGIELAGELHKNKSNIKVIFISGYKDFEYAQKAIAYGVKNYVVKSTKFNDLIDVFTKLRDEMDEEALDKTETYHSNLPDDSGKEYNYNEKIIIAIKKHVEKNYQNITLEDVAELVHMNPYYISRFFKQHTGENFSDYVIKIKMKKAAELLNDISFKTYEISNMVGYSNAKNFTRTFKKFYGKSPREFRNEKN